MSSKAMQLPSSLPRDYNNISLQVNRNAKEKRKGMKFFDSAEWVMDTSKLEKTKRALSEPLPKPTEDQIKKYISKFSEHEEISPIAQPNNI